MNLFALNAQELLGLTVLAAIITTLGNLLATILKDFVFSRSLEGWKEKASLASIHRKYRDPIALSGIELRRRLNDIVDQYPPNYLSSSVLKYSGNQLELNTDDDPHFKRYRLVSSVYRLCAFLGWLELYRQDLTFFGTGSDRVGRKVEKAISEFRADLAEGGLNTADDWHLWGDRLIFREEQRAIGESMISSVSGRRVVMGYGEFCTLFANLDVDESHWPLKIARGFLLDPRDYKDFRVNRLTRMSNHLADVISVLKR